MRSEEEAPPQSRQDRGEGLNRADREGLLTFVGLLDTDGRLVEVNAAALEAADLDADDVLGRPLWETPWWSWSESGQRRLRRAVTEVARGPSVRYDAELQVADDVRILVDFQLVPLRDEHGAISRLAPTGIDVTARRRQEDLFDELIAHAPVGFAQFDRAMRFVRINDALAEINGFTVAEHIGRTPMELMPDLPYETYTSHFEAALRGQYSEFEIEGRTNSGGRRVWLERIYPLRDHDGHLTGVGVFVLDITARKAVERERERAVLALQKSLLPRGVPRLAGAEVASRYVAATGATEVGGDFYEVLSGPEFGTAAFIGDVCGRGVEAAALTSLARYTLVPLIERHPGSPAASIVELNRILLDHHPEAGPRFLTLAVALLRAEGGGFALRLALGGHPPPVIVRAGGAVELFGRPGTLVGVKDRMQVWDMSGRLDPGDALVLYTDGYTEAKGPGRELFGDDRLLAALAPAAGASADDIADALDGAIEAFSADAPGYDDRALLVLRAAS